MDLDTLLALIRTGESERIEFKRSPTKTIHHEIAALANADGGNLIIGVDDNGAIVGTDVKNALEIITSTIQSVVPPPRIATHKIAVNDRDVLVVEVEKGASLCSVGGVVYIRIGTGVRPLSVQEILMLSSELGTVAWDGAPAAPEDEAEPAFIDWFFRAMQSARGRTIHQDDQNRYLRSVGAIRDGMLTNAGVLFFTDACDRIPHAGIRMIGMDRGEPQWSREYGGPVWQAIEAVYTDLQKEIRKREVIIGTRRVRIEEYPPRAIREAVINAVAHRNYTIGADVRIFIHPDKIEIRNPGGLMPGVDLSDPEHVPRNPSLSNLLYDTGFIERYGFGIRLIRREVGDHPLCSVTFSNASGHFSVIFSKKSEELIDAADRKILNATHTPMKSGEIAETVGLSKPTVLRRLKILEGLGLIMKEGSGAHVRYLAVR
ncbi:MAG TPA: ArsR family transcriptional regulator [Methanofollis liminatans]|uniref:ArsR family transcriptional regulator n=1 Tax=Methanofollis liminatans TaxID=2201 RepID=A0A831LMI4_9EURY|nr:ArsR family transcriptional regulator [Methanofollis liminatans]